MRTIVLFLFVALMPLKGYAAEFSSSYPNGEKYKELKGFLIAEIGNSNQHRAASPKTIYKLNQTCYVLDSYSNWGYLTNQASMILANSAGELNVAKVDTDFSGIKIEIEPITIVQCDAPVEDDSLINCTESLPTEQLLECVTLMGQRQEQMFLELKEQAEMQKRESELRLQQMQDQLKDLQR